MKVRLKLSPRSTILGDVSIHAPVKVRHDFLSDSRRNMGVSIHAPVKVRPDTLHNKSEKEFVSIHAPVKVRPNVDVVVFNIGLFQSTHP